MPNKPVGAADHPSLDRHLGQTTGVRGLNSKVSAGLSVPGEWEALAAEVNAGTVLIIGASDTGKSTLARYLFLQLAARGVRVAYLDADVGQSTIGLPCTMSVALCRTPGDLSFPPTGPSAAYFVGAITPRGHMLPTVIGAFKLCQRAVSWGAQVVIVDSTGLVDGAQGGHALKQWKTELLSPDLVIGLQRHRELEPILWPLRRERRLRCVDLSVSRHVVVRSRETRIHYRRERLAEYFSQALPHSLSVRNTVLYNLERLSTGALLAFQDADGFVLGLGVVRDLDRRRATCLVLAPLRNPEQAASVRIGVHRWNLESGCER